MQVINHPSRSLGKSRLTELLEQACLDKGYVVTKTWLENGLLFKEIRKPNTESKMLIVNKQAAQVK